MLKNYITVLLTLFMFTSFAQSDFSDVYSILQTRCSTSSCHGQGSAINSFNVNDSSSTLYNKLINGDPLNPYALNTAGYKLVVPGSPETSFLFRKLINCPSGLLSRNAAEGGNMPVSGQQLPAQEIELIFQWIASGASETVPFSPDTVDGDICDLPLSAGSIFFPEIQAEIYPNPFSDKFNVHFNLTRASAVSFEVLDLSGKVVYREHAVNFQPGSQIKTMQANFSKGVYFLKISADGVQTSVSRMVKTE